MAEPNQIVSSQSRSPWIAPEHQQRQRLIVCLNKEVKAYESSGKNVVKAYRVIGNALAVLFVAAMVGSVVASYFVHIPLSKGALFGIHTGGTLFVLGVYAILVMYVARNREKKYHAQLRALEILKHPFPAGCTPLTFGDLPLRDAELLSDTIPSNQKRLIALHPRTNAFLREYLEIYGLEEGVAGVALGTTNLVEYSPVAGSKENPFLSHWWKARKKETIAQQEILSKEMPVRNLHFDISKKRIFITLVALGAIAMITCALLAHFEVLTGLNTTSQWSILAVGLTLTGILWMRYVSHVLREKRKEQADYTEAQKQSIFSFLYDLVTWPFGKHRFPLSQRLQDYHAYLQHNEEMALRTLPGLSSHLAGKSISRFKELPEHQIMSQQLVDLNSLSYFEKTVSHALAELSRNQKHVQRLEEKEISSHTDQFAKAIRLFYEQAVFSPSQLQPFYGVVWKGILYCLRRLEGKEKLGPIDLLVPAENAELNQVLQDINQLSHSNLNGEIWLKSMGALVYFVDSQTDPLALCLKNMEGGTLEQIRLLIPHAIQFIEQNLKGLDPKNLALEKDLWKGIAYCLRKLAHVPHLKPPALGVTVTDDELGGLLNEINGPSSEYVVEPETILKRISASSKGLKELDETQLQQWIVDLTEHLNRKLLIDTAFITEFANNASHSALIEMADVLESMAIAFDEYQQKASVVVALNTLLHRFHRNISQNQNDYRKELTYLKEDIQRLAIQLGKEHGIYQRLTSLGEYVGQLLDGTNSISLEKCKKILFQVQQLLAEPSRQVSMSLLSLTAHADWLKGKIRLENKSLQSTIASHPETWVTRCELAILNREVQHLLHPSLQQDHIPLKKQLDTIKRKMVEGYDRAQVRNELEKFYDQKIKPLSAPSKKPSLSMGAKIKRVFDSSLVSKISLSPATSPAHLARNFRLLPIKQELLQLDLSIQRNILAFNLLKQGIKVISLLAFAIIIDLFVGSQFHLGLSLAGLFTPMMLSGGLYFLNLHIESLRKKRLALRGEERSHDPVPKGEFDFEKDWRKVKSFDLITSPLPADNKPLLELRNTVVKLGLDGYERTTNSLLHPSELDRSKPKKVKAQSEPLELNDQLDILEKRLMDSQSLKAVLQQQNLLSDALYPCMDQLSFKTKQKLNAVVLRYNAVDASDETKYTCAREALAILRKESRASSKVTQSLALLRELVYNWKRYIGLTRLEESHTQTIASLEKVLATDEPFTKSLISVFSILPFEEKNALKDLLERFSSLYHSQTEKRFEIVQQALFVLEQVASVSAQGERLHDQQVNSLLSVLRKTYRCQDTDLLNLVRNILRTVHQPAFAQIIHSAEFNQTLHSLRELHATWKKYFRINHAVLLKETLADDLLLEKTLRPYFIYLSKDFCPVIEDHFKDYETAKEDGRRLEIVQKALFGFRYLIRDQRLQGREAETAQIVLALLTELESKWKEHLSLTFEEVLQKELIYDNHLLYEALAPCRDNPQLKRIHPLLENIHSEYAHSISMEDKSFLVERALLIITTFLDPEQATDTMRDAVFPKGTEMKKWFIYPEGVPESLSLLQELKKKLQFFVKEKEVKETSWKELGKDDPSIVKYEETTAACNLASKEYQQVCKVQEEIVDRLIASRGELIETWKRSFASLPADKMIGEMKDLADLFTKPLDDQFKALKIWKKSDVNRKVVITYDSSGITEIEGCIQAIKDQHVRILHSRNQLGYQLTSSYLQLSKLFNSHLHHLKTYARNFEAVQAKREALTEVYHAQKKAADSLKNP